MRSKRGALGLFCLTLFASVASAATAQAADFHVLYSFTGPDGAFPISTSIFDESGNLYGTTSLGGSCPAFEDGCGTVFKIKPDGSETVFYAFKGQSDGDEPVGKLVRDDEGDFFGVTERGGGNGCDGARGCGTIFKLTSGGAEKILHVFPGGSGGSNPTGLVADRLGTLYGTTTYGGSHDLGTVFRVSLKGKFKLLYSFAGGKDGANPLGSLVLDKEGNLYGTTQFGGNNSCSSGCGTVFQLSADGKEKVLYAFHGGAEDGYQPMAGLLASHDGAFYGTTFYGGSGDCGTVFRLSLTGEESLRHVFDSDDGCFPVAPVIEDKKGNLYGTTMHGGPSFLGTAYDLAPDGKESVLYTFTGADDGCVPQAALARHNGRLYGTALTCGSTFNGTVFSVRP